MSVFFFDADIRLLLRLARGGRPAKELAASLTLETLDALKRAGEDGNPAQDLLVPILFHRLEEAGLLDRLPAATREALQRKRLTFIGQELLRAGWLKGFDRLLAREGAEVLLLKGAAFSGALYPPEAARVGSDLDLLVREADFERVRRCLAADFHESKIPGEGVARRRTHFWTSFTRERPFPLDVDLHRGLAEEPLFAIDMSRLWAASRPHPCYGSERLRVLVPEHALLTLAIQGFRDLDLAPFNLLDAHELLRRSPLDGQELLNCAEAFGAKGVLFFLLEAVGEILDAPLPPGLPAKLAPAAWKRRLAGGLFRRRFDHARAGGRLGYKVNKAFSQVLLLDSPRPALRFQSFYWRAWLSDALRRHPDLPGEP